MAALLGPVLLVVGILLLARSQPQAASSGGKGLVQVAFTGTLQLEGNPTVSVATAFQRVLLNVVAVRLHPSSNLSVSDFDPRWVTIAAPAKIGLSNPVEFISTSLNFGGSLGRAELTAAISVLQLDLDALQNLPFFFNSGNISAQSYGQAELILNPTVPGTVIPLCPASTPAGEGCIPYAVTLSGTGTKLRAQFLDSSGNPTKYDVAAKVVQPLVINVAVTVGAGPTADPSKSTVTITPAITPCGIASPCGNGVLNGVPFNSALGVANGIVDGDFDLKTTTVTAEFSGTNQIVATTKLQTGRPCPVGAPACFTLNLPALPCATIDGSCVIPPLAPNSTLYDFYVSGSGAYVVRSGVAVSSLGAASGSPPVADLGTLTVPSATFSSITGAVHDACVAGKPIEAATLQLLVPDTSVGGSSCDLTGSPPIIPSNCVVVGTAATDEQGSYPLPASNGLPQPFNHVPEPPLGDHYDLEVSAPGYNTTVQEVAAGPIGRLDFTLEHGFITGTTMLSSPDASGNPLDVLVMAEDSGTDNVENLAFSTIAARATSGSFKIPVPDAAPSSIPPAGSVPVKNFDVFGVVQDIFGNQPQKTTGHLIGTAASVGAPLTACATIDIKLSAMDCAGLGSVFGSVSGANPSTTSVRLSKNSVQIMTTEPNSIGFPSSGNNIYNFCAPADTGSYVLTHDETAGPQATPSPVSSAAVTLTSPTAIPSPCTSICGATRGDCLLCQPTAGPTL
jgi:hypothetical protein